MAHFHQTKIFWEKSLVSFLSTYLPLPLYRILKNSCNGSTVMKMHHFWTQNEPIFLNDFFFKKPINKPCSYYSFLYTFQKSNSKINLLMKYWLLKNTEISLGKKHFGHKVRTRFCYRMLKDYKKFRFAPIPDKNNDLIFLKSPKTLLFGPF